MSKAKVQIVLETLDSGGFIGCYPERDYHGKPIDVARLYPRGVRPYRKNAIKGIGPVTLRDPAVLAMLPMLIDKYGFVPGSHRTMPYTD